MMARTRSAAMIAAALALASMTPAAAQPAASCPACAHGDVLIEKFTLQPVRAIASELVAPLGDPVSAAEYARLVDLRRRTPTLVRLGALDNGELLAVATALCHAAKGPCVDATLRTLICLADRCTVDLPRPEPRRADLVALPADCHQYSNHTASPPFGVGFDWGSGGQRSRYPSDGSAWSFGIAGRMRFGRIFGAVARVDRISGRDEATDTNGDGNDDVSTGSITRISALAGPTIVLDNTRFEDTTRYLRLDLLGGYVSTRSQPNESGPAAGFDLAYQLSILRFGVRFVQGFGDASDATMLLAHVGFTAGSAPPYDDDTDCGALAATRSSRLALGLDFPLGGYGISSDLGYLAPGFAIEAAWHLSPQLDAMARGDVLVYPGYERDRVLHQALLAGMRIDHGKSRGGETGWFTTVLAGYTHGAALTPTTVGSGAVVDLSLGWGGQNSEGAGYLRLHTRFGVGPDNFDYRAVFLSAGFEVRFDPRAWIDRS
jgi:hypothetical protein